MVRQTIACPHCGLETKLFIPQGDVVAKPTTPIQPTELKPQLETPSESNIVALSYVLSFLLPIAGFFFGVYLMAKKKSSHGAACMALSIVLGLGWLAFFSSSGFKLFDEQGTILNGLIAVDAQQKSDENLRAVQSAYGWNLGDKLPNDLEVKTNDDSFGIIHDFDLQSQSGFGHLVLTEDRRIASISILGMAKTQENEVRKTLKGKYGFRQIRHITSDGDYLCYYGTTNRQVIFSRGVMIWLEYRDEELCKTADSQKEKRQSDAAAAVRKRIENDLKTHL